MKMNGAYGGGNMMESKGSGGSMDPLAMKGGKKKNTSGRDPHAGGNIAGTANMKDKAKMKKKSGRGM